MIKFRRFDKKSDVTAFLPIFWAYWYHVNGVDAAGIEEFTLTERDLPETVRLPKIEAILYGYIYKGYEIQLCENDEGEIVAFMLYHMVFDYLLEIRGMYCEKPGLGGLLVHSLRLPIKKLIFQTRAKHPPLGLLNLTIGRRKMLGETGELITWEMEWRQI